MSQDLMMIDIGHYESESFFWCNDKRVKKFISFGYNCTITKSIWNNL